MMRRIDMVIDLQFGSTGKGLLAGWLAQNHNYDTIVTAWAPNAGHTFVDQMGRKFVHCMLANGIVGPSVRRVLMGPGSILDLEKLSQEIEACMDIIQRQNISISIHPHAAIVTQDDRDAEKESMTAIGSTKKGVGAAAIKKILRNPRTLAVAKDYYYHPIFSRFEGHVALVKSPQDYSAIYESSKRILIEGAQGFGLSMQHGFYPYTTSRDVTPNQILADCGIPFGDSKYVEVWGTARTYPIRVANRYDEHGDKIGWSGPCYADQREMEWSELGLEAELTTVTKLPRRLFSYSQEQMAFARRLCNPTHIFLNFVNYIKDYEYFEDINDSLTRDGDVEVLYGIGPNVQDVINVSRMSASSTKMWDIIQRAINGA